MKSEDLLDPELKPFLAGLPTSDLSGESLPQIRAGIKDMLSKLPTAPDAPVRVESYEVPGSLGAPSVRVVGYRPETAEANLCALLHIHGGGYVVGAPEMADVANRRLVSELGCAIFSVDYRLAPETRFPGSLEDCYAVLLWLATNAKRLGVSASYLGVKGESAGGGLAAALALLTRDRSGPRLAFQQLIYPMLDDQTCIDPDPNPYTGHFVWNRQQNDFGWSSLLGKQPGSPDVLAYAAPARAENLAGLPSTFIGVGSLDLFLDENLAYAGRLSRAGVEVELHVYPGAFHRFYEAPKARVAQAAERDSRDALRSAMQA